MTDAEKATATVEIDPRVERAIRRLEFLASAQQLKAKPPRTMDAYKRDGRVLWLAELPNHPAVRSIHRIADPEPEAEILSIDRVPRLDPPQPDRELLVWLRGGIEDPYNPPTLREEVTVEDPQNRDEVTGRSPSQTLTLQEHPHVRNAFERWLTAWRSWAAKELRDRPVREMYGNLFSAYVTWTSHPEEYELVAAAGCLAWHPPEHPPVRRHLITAPAAIRFDDDSGRLTVVRAESVDAAQVELDMLDPGIVKNAHHINEVRATARGLESHPLHRDTAGELVRRVVQTLDAQARYVDTDVAPEVSEAAIASYGPAIILRKRSRQGMVEIFRTIIEQIADSGRVPEGLLPLVDPDHRPATHGDSSEGALVWVDDDPFLPLPVNDVQLRIIERVDSHAQILVQGPPGTGKTHTAAALISHLLAQGKRILVTAQTDRALKEVREKLPEEIRPLSVAVVGTSREDMADLKLAVARIRDAAVDHDPEAAARRIEQCLESIDRLRRQRAENYRRLIEARRREVDDHHRGCYRGTLASIAKQLRAQEGQHGWLAGLVAVEADASSPLSGGEMVEWHNYLLDERLRSDEQEAHQRLPRRADLPSPEEFARMVEAEARAQAAAAAYQAATEHEAFEVLLQRDAAERSALQQRLRVLAEEADSLASRNEPWMNDALADVHSGRGQRWHARAARISELIEAASPLVTRLGPLTDVDVPEDDVAPLIKLAQILLSHLQDGGTVKTDADGTPRLGFFTSKPIKQASPLFQSVRVNGLPPTTPDQVSAFLDWCEATRILAALDRAWPENVVIPAEDTFHERLHWHSAELEQLRRVLRLSEELEAEERRLADLGLPVPDWDDLQAVQDYAATIDAAAAHDALREATRPLDQQDTQLADVARRADAAPTVHHLRSALAHRDRNQYATAYDRLRRLEDVRRQVARREDLEQRLRAAAAGLVEAVASNPGDPAWRRRLTAFTEAWEWASASAWLLAQERVDVNALQVKLTSIDERIRQEVEKLSAIRGWSHAVAPERITGSARQDLETYAFLVRKFGKGKGKYALQHQADIRQAMDRCRSSVPVWIMPIYRIAEQLRIQPNMFDVVIVDEASQAGLEAIFLQYLAPKIVVIGDDKQVSPAAVGIDRGQLRSLGEQFLNDAPYRAAWENPERSLFDEAKMRFGGLMTLTEHRRCVPEIIGFSNRVAYEPEGIRLIPVRQYGVDRLEPIVPVFVHDGYTRGKSANKINPAEVDAIVHQVEKCIADPRYDGLTFGVISLLGRGQAKAIERKLLERIEPEEWAARDLRCGDSADFQGAERNVMFLSMVAATEPDKTIGALTRDIYVQRYNVAASRAKDQVWVFHSVGLSDLGNPEDMRFQFLDYCYGIVNRGKGNADGAITSPVPEDVRVEPFESLFEQRVFNRILDRGFTVIPQRKVQGYRIDLVVVGARARLAVECDGDTWHGPDAYERDLARQRDLERCGWNFFRIRESAFYADPVHTLQGLWEALEELDIHPSGWQGQTQRGGPREVWEGERPLDGGSRTDGAASSDPAETVIGEAPSGDTPESAAARMELEVPDTEVGSSPSREGGRAGLSTPNGPVTSATASMGAVLSSPRISLARYRAYQGRVASPLQATRKQLMEGIREVVAVEGPVVGHRLHSAYVRAAGGQRVGKQIAKALNSAITAAVRRGLLVEDNPLEESGVKPRTFRLPEQPDVVMRELGPRSFEHVPPRELATLVAVLADHHGWEVEEALWRAVLEVLGLKRLTANVTARLRGVMPLARQIAVSAS